MRLTLAILLILPGIVPAQNLGYESGFLKVRLSPTSAGLEQLEIDGLGLAEFRPSGLIPEPSSPSPYVVSREGDSVAYRAGSASTASAAAWRVQLGARVLRIESNHAKGQASAPFVLTFAQRINHVTLLGIGESGQVRLPALLHIPDSGSVRIDGDRAVRLGFDASRVGSPFVRVSLPAATRERRRVRYTMTVDAIYPREPAIAGDARYNGFRRGYLNGLQMQARMGLLANNSASDACPSTLYEAALLARYAPPLAPGLRALDLVRVTLDRYLGGFKGYGQPGFRMFEGKSPEADAVVRYPFLDVYPSLLVSAAEYVDGTSDRKWLRHNYAGLRGWADTMSARDTDGNGLLKYPASGNLGSWNRDKTTLRPANWWDTVGFGHEDAYSNALAYHALRRMASLSKRMGDRTGARRYADRANKLRAAYYGAFLNRETGVLAGWRSADGQLHDYVFPLVSGAAVVFGLLTPEQGNAAFDRMLDKLAAVHYDRFDLGLPGNLVPIRQGDYVELKHRWGRPSKEDGSDAFQIYENGGATSCFAYFTVAALYKLGRKTDGDRIFLPMLDSLGKGNFSGTGANGMTNDWKNWNGEAWGYEGFLADNYFTLLGVLARSRPDLLDR